MNCCIFVKSAGWLNEIEFSDSDEVLANEMTGAGVRVTGGIILGDWAMLWNCWWSILAGLAEMQSFFYCVDFLQPF